MQLIKLKTTNFKRLGTFECDFTEGLNVIAGDNAAGKSTLLQAIEAALFGASVIPGKIENVPTWGQKNFSLELHFAAKAEVYILTRNKGTAKLIAFGYDQTERLVANGNTPVKAAVEEILGLAAKDYNLFVQSKQGESTGILTFGATALNRKVEEFAGVDLIDKVQAAAQLKATRASAAADAKRVDDALIDEQAIAVAQAQEALRSAERALADAEAELAKGAEYEPLCALIDVAALRAEVHTADLLWGKVEAAAAAFEVAKKGLADTQARVSGIKKQDSTELAAELTRLKAEGLKHKDAHIIAMQQLEGLRGKNRLYALLEGNVTLAKQALEAIKVPADQTLDLADLQLDLDAKQEALDTARAALATQQANLQNLYKLAEGAACPTCKRAFEDHDPAALAAEVTAAEAELLAIRKAMITAKDAHAGAEAKFKTAARYHHQYDTAAEALQEKVERLVDAVQVSDVELAEASDAVEGTAAVIEAAREVYATKQAELKQVDENNARWEQAMADMRKAESVWATAEDAHKALAKQYEDLPEPPDSYQIKAAEDSNQLEQERRQAHQQAKAKADGQVNLCRAELAADQRVLESAQIHLNDLLARNKAAAAEAAVAKQCARLVQFLRERRQAYLQEVWTVILSVSSRLVRDASKGRITAIGNHEGDFTFEEEGVVAPISSASGAQKSFIGTAMRVGLARALYGSDSLLSFDEPTESCSEHNASSMSAMLSTSAKQVLLITHRETDQQLASNIINVGE